MNVFNVKFEFDDESIEFQARQNLKTMINLLFAEGKISKYTQEEMLSLLGYIGGNFQKALTEVLSNQSNKFIKNQHCYIITIGEVEFTVFSIPQSKVKKVQNLVNQLQEALKQP